MHNSIVQYLKKIQTDNNGIDTNKCKFINRRLRISAITKYDFYFYTNY